jgi:hypothetical protein
MFSECPLFVFQRLPGSPSHPLLLFCKGHPEFVLLVSAFCIRTTPGFLRHPPFVLERSPPFCIQTIPGLLRHPPFISPRLPQFRMHVHLEHLPSVRSWVSRFLYSNCTRAAGSTLLLFYTVTQVSVLTSTGGTCHRSTGGVRFLYSNPTQVSQSPFLLFCKSRSELVSQVSAFSIQIIPGFLGHPLSFWPGHPNLY